MADKLTDAKRTEFDNYYQEKHADLPICPTCNTKDDVIPTVRGKPSSDLLAYAEEGHVKLSGCKQSYNGWCKKCQKFL